MMDQRVTEPFGGDAGAGGSVSDNPAAEPADLIGSISHSILRLRIMIGRRVIGRLALANVAPMLDLSDLDVLGLVPRGGAGGVAVGDIARVLRIDPSRASRLVAGLVQNGFLVRGVAQEDARRAVLLRSEKGERVFEEIRRVKCEVIADIMQGWAPDEAAVFAAGFERFIRGWEEHLDAFDGVRAVAVSPAAGVSGDVIGPVAPRAADRRG